MRILLLEDETDLGFAIKRTLSQEKYIVDWVTDGQTAWEYLAYQQTDYSVAILDWLVPQLSGLELLRKLRESHNSLPVLMLTAKDSMEDKVIGLDAGADDYLIKPFNMVELLARLRALQRRSPLMQPQKLQVGDLILDYATYEVYCLTSGGKKAVGLTNKEFQLLEYFMTHPRQILTTDQIREQLWEIGADSYSNVVAAQVRLLRRKLEKFGYDQLINTVHGIGYCFKLQVDE